MCFTLLSLTRMVVKCSVCVQKHQSSTVRVLPCHHAVCLQCLEQLAAASGDGKITCTRCKPHVAHEIPPSGVQAFLTKKQARANKRAAARNEAQAETAEEGRAQQGAPRGRSVQPEVTVTIPEVDVERAETAAGVHQKAPPVLNPNNLQGARPHGSVHVIVQPEEVGRGPGCWRRCKRDGCCKCCACERCCSCGGNCLFCRKLRSDCPEMNCRERCTNCCEECITFCAYCSCKRFWWVVGIVAIETIGVVFGFPLAALGVVIVVCTTCVFCCYATCVQTGHYLACFCGDEREEEVEDRITREVRMMKVNDQCDCDKLCEKLEKSCSDVYDSVEKFFTWLKTPVLKLYSCCYGCESVLEVFCFLCINSVVLIVLMVSVVCSSVIFLSVVTLTIATIICLLYIWYKTKDYAPKVMEVAEGVYEALSAPVDPYE